MLLRGLTSELSNHIPVVLHRFLKDLLGRVHFPAPLGAHRVGVVSAQRKWERTAPVSMTPSQYYKPPWSASSFSRRPPAPTLLGKLAAHDPFNNSHIRCKGQKYSRSPAANSNRRWENAGCHHIVFPHLTRIGKSCVYEERKCTL